MLRRIAFSLGAVTLAMGTANAQMGHQHGPSEAACAEATLRCATRVTPTFAADGTLWLTWMAGGQVSVAHSTDRGIHLSGPVPVTTEPLDLDWGPDARPKIVVDRQGRVVVAFARFRDKAFNGEVLISHSTDGGKSFDKLRPITPNTESQRFEALALDADGAVFAAWLDKRNRVPAKEKGVKYDGAGLFFAWSRDGGASLSEARLAADNTCECCRLGVAFAAPGRPAVIFRNIFDGGIRDHAVITFDAPDSPGELHRVSDDDWRIDACPHHGPSLTISRQGTYHATWFTNGKARKGLFYARSVDSGRTFSPPLPIGASGRSPSRPYVLSAGGKTALVWKEFDGETTTVNLMVSRDDGKSWSAPTVLARTADASDHPLLVSDRGELFLSWMTKADGYRLLPIESTQ